VASVRFTNQSERLWAGTGLGDGFFISEILQCTYRSYFKYLYDIIMFEILKSARAANVIKNRVKFLEIKEKNVGKIILSP
jgi:hypothetical protein